MDGPRSSDRVTLVGLDFGSTTMSLLVIEAAIASHCVTGRMGFERPQTVYRSEPVFTPFRDLVLDLPAIEARVRGWLAEAGIVPRDVFAGGAIVTGLAAERENADALAGLVVDLIGEAVVATADDPRLESWLAFMGGAAALSRASPERRVLNLDIGGGTTNAALGRAGEVVATGCHFIGARHFEVEPGTYRLRRISRYGSALLDLFGIAARNGDELDAADVARITGYQVAALKALVSGNRVFFQDAAGRLIEQVPFAFEGEAGEDPIVTFSGGVGEIVYALAAVGSPPPRTLFGDLGIDLAEAIVADPRLSRDLVRYIPEQRGRATVQGLTLSHTEISGTTLFIAGDGGLPLRDLPVVATLPATANEADLSHALALAGQSHRGAALHIVWTDEHPAFADVKRLGLALAAALDETDFPAEAPLVVLTTANVGKALGSYATRWGQSGRRMIVIDEIPVRNARFVNLGRLRNGVVPVSFYGIS